MKGRAVRDAVRREVGLWTPHLQSLSPMLAADGSGPALVPPPVGRNEKERNGSSCQSHVLRESGSRSPRSVLLNKGQPSGGIVRPLLNGWLMLYKGSVNHPGHHAGTHATPVNHN